jgi:hypothetical protein
LELQNSGKDAAVDIQYILNAHQSTRSNFTINSKLQKTVGTKNSLVYRAALRLAFRSSDAPAFS